jgi:uncharacterized protein (DUF779 family)
MARQLVLAWIRENVNVCFSGGCLDAKGASCFPAVRRLPGAADVVNDP